MNMYDVYVMRAGELSVYQMHIPDLVQDVMQWCLEEFEGEDLAIVEIVRID